MANFDELYQQINWQQPWYDTLYLPQFSDFYEAQSVYQGLNSAILPSTLLFTQQQKPIHFVPQSALPDNTAYESFISDTGNICTRDNIHDLLNGLIWLNYPKTKAVLNHLHTLDIAQNGITAQRSALRNALTLFDENGGIVVSSDSAVLTQLQGFEWESVLFDGREKWLEPGQAVQFFPFGHALLEKLVAPRKNITSHVLLLLVKPNFFDLTSKEQREKLDSILAERFLADFATLLQSKNFQPLPVMGIPSFCEDNEGRDFYQDKAVFREARNKKALILPLFAS